MILNSEKTKCDTNMTGATKFTIQANAKMFRILSSGLYSNKEKAIIREVSCNAYDANTDAGNGDVPIVVHLPNALEPYLSIKDSGPGLNPEQMVSIYTQYGNSTKTDRNDQIGALGLGSKSPFSYIDSFTVISITEGLKATYSCYIDGNGEPQLQPFGQEDTDEPNGVEVTFPVKQEDYTKFREEAEIVYRPFEVKPTITGNKEYQEKKFDVLLSSENSDLADWQIVEPINTSYYNRDKIRVAVQGNIEYPISTRKIEEAVSTKAQRLLNENFRLHFNIGELDIAASREELGYDKITIENIVAKFEKMADEIEEAQNKKIESFENKYDVMSYISTIKASSNIYRDLKFSYRDEPINNFVTIDESYEIVKYYQGRRGISRDTIGRSYNSSWSFTVPKESEEVIYVYCDNDKKAQAVTKARSLVKYGNSVYLVNNISFFNSVGNPEYLNSSEIEAPAKNNNKGKGSFYKRFYNSNNYNYQWDGTFSPATSFSLDLNKKFYYVPIKGKRTDGNYNIFSLLEVAKELGLIKDNTQVYGVTISHSNSKKFKDGNGINFLDEMRIKIKKSRKFKAKLKGFASHDILRIIQNVDGCILNLIESNTFIDKLTNNEIFKEVKEALEDARETTTDGLGKYKEIASELRIEVPVGNYVKHKEIGYTYPLLKLVSNWNIDEDNMVDYINGIDLLKEQEEQNQQIEKEVA